jgi:hypothetical protein
VRRLEEAGELRLERFMSPNGTVLPIRYHLRPDAGRG